MVAERNFVEVVFACEFDKLCAALRAAPVTVQLAAFFEAGFYGDILKVERYLRVFFCHALQKFARSLVCKIALNVNGGKFAFWPEFAESCGEFHQQHARILATACGDEHAVSVFNQVEVVNCFRDFLINSLAYLTRHDLLYPKLAAFPIARHFPLKFAALPFVYTILQNKKGSLARALKSFRTTISCR